jgi:hypothetical protein
MFRKKITGGSLDLVLFLFFLVFQEIAVFVGIFFLFLLLIRNEIQLHRMGLHDLQLDIALRTAQDLAFFDFVFIHVDLGGAFRATDHGADLLWTCVSLRVLLRTGLVPSGVLYTAESEVNPHCAWWCSGNAGSGQGFVTIR